MRRSLAALPAIFGLVSEAQAAGLAWATVWAASAQGPYPSGNASAQPDQRFALPEPARGASDQTLRMVVKPSLWGRQARFRFSNAFGTRPLQLNGGFVGLQHGGATVLAGSNRPLRFGGSTSIRIPPGGMAWSDPVALPFARNPDHALLAGRKLAISFHVVGESGPMTWHAKALQTSYLSAPGAGARGAEESEASFPYSTTSCFFLDAVDMMAPVRTPVVVCFGDSITDGTASTLNGDDRWPDVVARRLYAAFGNRVAVVNAGIGGNQIVGPASYSAANPFPGGPAALARLDRDVISLSGVTTVVWLEGTNDLSRNGRASIDQVLSGMQDGVRRLRAAIPGVRVVGATLVSALRSTSPAHGFAAQEENRQVLNSFIRAREIFDAVVDFDDATLDIGTGELRPEMVPDSTMGGPGDKLHPNRAGYLAMGNAIDPGALVPQLASAPVAPGRVGGP